MCVQLTHGVFGHERFRRFGIAAASDVACGLLTGGLIIVIKKNNCNLCEGTLEGRD
jgi:hypothetical protein